MTFEPTLTWNAHSQLLYQRLAFTNSLLLKLHTSNIPRFLILTIYKAFFLPLLTYAVHIWGFTTQRNIKRFRTIQNTSLRIIWGLRKADSVRSTYQHHSLLPFGTIRFRQAVTMIHQFLHYTTANRSPTNPHFYHNTTRNTRSTDAYTLYLPGPNVESRKATLYYTGITLYNSLPLTIRQTTSFKKAKKLI